MICRHGNWSGCKVCEEIEKAEMDMRLEIESLRKELKNALKKFDTLIEGDSTMSDYKREVVESAIQGLIQGGMSEPEAHNLKNLLEVVYQCGYNEAVRDPAYRGIE